MIMKNWQSYKGDENDSAGINEMLKDFDWLA